MMGYYQAFFTALLTAIIFLIIAIPTWLTLVWELLSKSWTERILESANAKHHITWSSTAKKKQWLRAKRKARKVALTPYRSPCMLCLNPTVIAALLRFFGPKHANTTKHGRLEWIPSSSNLWILHSTQEETTSI